MKILLTVQEIVEQGGWGAFAEDKGYDIWAYEHCKILPYLEVKVSIEDARRYGFRIVSPE